MNKSELITQLAQIPDGDPKLYAVFAAITGIAESERPYSHKLWPIGEAAREAYVSRSTLWRMVKEGRLRAVEIRKGSLRIPDSELRRLAEGT